jgi:23S rRNA (guanine745-N1)-methyltransferase
MKQPNYQCPLCHLPLSANVQGFNCTNNHQFDQAKEGYVNLLPVQNKGSKVPGDSKEMIQARRDFLASGAYAFLQQALTQQVAKQRLIDSAVPCTVIDIGCGEGYYTNALSSLSPDYPIYGVDISKSAVRLAAKRYKTVDFSVASHLNLPFADNSAELVSKVFAPMTATEVLRVLKSDGLLLSVVPGPKHLFELKQIIYDNANEHQVEDCPAGFELIESQAISTSQTLTDAAQITNLTQMTPLAWKISDNEKQQLIDSCCFSVTFDFVINVYRVVAD